MLVPTLAYQATLSARTVDDAFDEQPPLHDRYERASKATEAFSLDDSLTETDYVVHVERVDAPGAAHGSILFVLGPQD
ncbi:hypothetical protein [Halorubellus sp. PRR65]|uniref:hypothetical protein n=1 Tax=Halorubellus sp. PRR65 TaxID=3098148 RepID=UPI002B259967|nr:hypothetical protein [Halorubellus sp. PRR65]